MKYTFKDYFNQALDKTASYIQEIPLLEMATERQAARDKISNYTITLWLHLYCLQLKSVSHASTTHHWKEEIKGFLSNIDDALIKLHKRFSAAEIYNIIAENKQAIEKAKRLYKKKWDTTQTPTSHDDLVIQSILEKISYALATPTNMDEVEEIIEQLN